MLGNHRTLLCFVLFFVIIAGALILLVGCAGAAGSSSSGAPVQGAASPSPTPTPGASPSPTPTNPANTVVLNDVEDSPNWFTCGSCGNTGGTGPTAGYSFTVGMPAPSEDGRSTQFAIAATVPFTNGYFYRQQTAIPHQITALTYEFDLYVPPGMENAPQAIEFECQQTLDGWVYNFAWQADYAINQWRIFDYGLKRWDSTPLNLIRFTPGTWHHVLAEYHNDTTAHTVIHDALTIDGTRSPVNITHNAFFSGSGAQFTNAFQLDSNGTATPYNVSVDKMTITYQ